MSDSAVTLDNLAIWTGNYISKNKEGFSTKSRYKEKTEETAFNNEISYVRSSIHQENEGILGLEIQRHRNRLMQKLSDIEALGDDWSEDVKGPNEFAISFSEKLIDQLVEDSFIPDRLTQSVEEGVSFVFAKENCFLYLEIYNDTEMGLLVEDYKNKRVLKNKEMSSQREILEEISEFFDYV